MSCTSIIKVRVWQSQKQVMLMTHVMIREAHAHANISSPFFHLFFFSFYPCIMWSDICYFIIFEVPSLFSSLNSVTSYHYYSFFLFSQPTWRGRSLLLLTSKRFQIWPSSLYIYLILCQQLNSNTFLQYLCCVLFLKFQKPYPRFLQCRLCTLAPTSKWRIQPYYLCSGKLPARSARNLVPVVFLKYSNFSPC